MSAQLVEELRVAAAEWTLGRRPQRSFDSLAADLIAAGVDGPAVVDLAVLDSEEVPAELTLRAALAEVDLELPLPVDARRTVAATIAARIVDGSISPRDGADEIWTELVGPVDGDPMELRPLNRFGAFVDDWHDFPERRPAIESEIVRHAESILADVD